MDRQTVINELSSIIGEYLKMKELDLVDFIYRYEGRDLFLRIIADKPEGGITLDECAHLNNELGRILDEKNILQVRYVLEVSSPGLDRPLKTEKDFLRCINKKAKIFLSVPINGKKELDGLISKVEDNSAYIDTGAKILNIPLSKITRAKQIINNI